MFFIIISLLLCFKCFSLPDTKMNYKLSSSVLFLFAFMVLSCTVSCDTGPKTEAGLKETNKILQNQIEKLKEELVNKDNDRKAEIQKLEEQYKAEVDRLNQRLEDQDKDSKTSQSEEIERLKKRHAEELSWKQDEINKLQEEINKQTEKIQAYEKSSQIDQMTQNMINRLPDRYKTYLWTCAIIYITFSIILLGILSLVILKYYTFKNQLLSSINSNIQQLKENE